MKEYVIDCNPVNGVVNYGSIDCDLNRYTFITKIRCFNCGNAWLAENYVDGADCCPKCGIRGKKFIKWLSRIIAGERCDNYEVFNDNIARQ